MAKNARKATITRLAEEAIALENAAFGAESIYAEPETTPVDEMDIMSGDILSLMPEVVEVPAPIEEPAPADLDDAELEAALSEIAAEAETANEPTEEPAKDETLEDQANHRPLSEMLAEVTREDAVAMQGQVIKSLDDRVTYEITKDLTNDSIQKTLKKCRDKLAISLDPSRVMVVANVDPQFINRHLGDGSRYNVYAVDKVQDFLNFLGGAKGELTNAINIACMKSLFAFRKAGVPFTGEASKGAASVQYARKLDSAVQKLLISHTVAPTTAPTQSSSTMQALETLGVVSVLGSRKAPTYILNDTPLARRLEERYAA